MSVSLRLSRKTTRRGQDPEALGVEDKLRSTNRTGIQLFTRKAGIAHTLVPPVYYKKCSLLDSLLEHLHTIGQRIKLYHLVIRVSPSRRSQCALKAPRWYLKPSRGTHNNASLFLLSDWNPPVRFTGRKFWNPKEQRIPDLVQSCREHQTIRSTYFSLIKMVCPFAPMCSS